MSNPRIEGYLRILYKINEIYSNYDIDNVDLLDEIGYYYSKNNYSDDEIKDLQNKCNFEWKNILILLCKNLINKIEAKEYYKKLLKTELKQAKKQKIELRNEKKTLDEYEKIFDKEFSKLQDTVDIKIVKEEKDNSRFWWGLVTGVAITLFGLGVTYFIF